MKHSQESKTDVNPKQIELPDDVAEQVIELDSHLELITDPEDRNALLFKKKELLTPFLGDDPSEEEDDEDDEDGEDDDSAEDDEDDEDSTDVFGVSKKEKKAKPVEIKTLDDANNLLKQFGVSDMGSFFESAKKWRTGAQTAAQAEKRAKDLELGISSLPNPLKNGILAVSNGKDWIGEVLRAASEPDYNAEPDSQKKKILSHYMEEDLKSLNQEIDREEDPEGYKRREDLLFRSAKALFIADKKAYEVERTLAQKDLEAKEAMFSTSIESSVAELQKAFPNFNKKELSKIQSILESPNGVLSLFVDGNGTYKPEAAKLLSFAIYGESKIKAEADIARKKGKSEATEEIIDRTVRKKGEKPKLTDVIDTLVQKSLPQKKTKW